MSFVSRRLSFFSVPLCLSPESRGVSGSRNHPEGVDRCCGGSPFAISGRDCGSIRLVCWPTVFICVCSPRPLRPLWWNPSWVWRANWR